MRDLGMERVAALTQAVELHKDDPCCDRTAHVLATAHVLFRWLTAPLQLSLTYGTVLDQGTGQPTGTTLKGSPMQLHDTEQVDLTVTVSDAKGVSIPDDSGTTTDDLAWSIDDTTVASLTVSSDTRTCTVVAGLPGSTVGTVTLGELSATFTVDVIPGGAAKIEIAEGIPVEQPPAAG